MNSLSDTFFKPALRTVDHAQPTDAVTRVTSPASEPVLANIDFPSIALPSASTRMPCHMALALPVRVGSPPRAEFVSAVDSAFGASPRKVTSEVYQVSPDVDDVSAMFNATWQAFVCDPIAASWTARLLHYSDQDRGFMDLVQSLSGGRPLSQASFKHIAASRLANNHFTLVVDNGSRIVATASMLLEYKFSHTGGLAGHIEDVIVADSYRKRGLGLAVVEVLKEFGATVGVYKCILDATDENVPFYRRAQFEPSEIMLSYKPGAHRNQELVPSLDEVSQVHE